MSEKREKTEFPHTLPSPSPSSLALSHHHHITSFRPAHCSPPAVAFSFNGGKDSTVILHLLRAAVAARRRGAAGDGGGGEQPPSTTATAPQAGGGGEPPLSASGVRAFIFDRPADDFPAVREFVEAADAAHGLRLEHLSLGGGEAMKCVLAAYLARSGVKAVLLGTRRGDPNAPGQAEFCPSSPGWPPFLRVNPVLEWGYGDVWAFLGAAAAAYCPLYDRGFTSLGSTGSTSPNAALLRLDGSYAPARELADGREERAGRKGRGGASSLQQQQGQDPPRPATAPTRTAAVLVIGDELLAAWVEEVNARFLCAALHGAGWRVARVVVLPDEVGAIAAEVASAAATHTAVLIAGGVGPTEDDVTMAAVGEWPEGERERERRETGEQRTLPRSMFPPPFLKPPLHPSIIIIIKTAAAFSVPLARDPDLEARLRSYFANTDGKTITEAHLKMADAPEGVEAVEVVVGGGDESNDANAAAAATTPPRPSPFPLLSFRNCFILPGVPALLHRKWPALEAALAARFGACAPFRAVSLRLSVADESAVAPALAAAGAACGGRARVGSYPLDPPSPEDGASLVVVVEGKDAGAVRAGVAAARGALPAWCVVLGEVEGGAV